VIRNAETYIEAVAELFFPYSYNSFSNKYCNELLVSLTAQKDSSSFMVFLFRPASCSRFVVGIRTTWCLHGSRSSDYHSASLAVCGCFFVPSAQGTSVYYLRFSDVEHCRSCSLSPLVSVVRYNYIYVCCF